MCLVTGLSLLFGPGLSFAQRSSLNTSIIADNQEDTYRRCLVAAELAPETGLDMARRWRNLNGGEPADHCAALALVGLGDAEEAAHRLLDLAARSTSPSRVKAGLYGHAARAWMTVEIYQEALPALDRAIELHGRNVEFYFDRALCHAALKNYWAAVDDLNVVLDTQPRASDALVLRGSAYRRLDLADLAFDDIDRALTMDPTNLNALLEKGLLLQESGEVTRARKTWIRILELEPESAAGDAVRGHLERLDLNVEPFPESPNAGP